MKRYFLFFALLISGCKGLDYEQNFSVQFTNNSGIFISYEVTSFDIINRDYYPTVIEFSLNPNEISENYFFECKVKKNKPELKYSLYTLEIILKDSNDETFWGSPHELMENNHRYLCFFEADLIDPEYPDTYDTILKDLDTGKILRY